MDAPLWGVFSIKEVNNMKKSTEVFDCFIFPSNIDRIECFVNSEVLKLSCKKISLTSEIYNIRNDLNEKFGISSISSITVLDKHNLFIASSDYDKINSPEINTKDKNVINAFKTYLFPLAASTLTTLNDELYQIKIHNIKENRKIQRKRALRDRLQNILFKDNTKSK